jgi:hypothetical protein
VAEKLNDQEIIAEIALKSERKDLRKVAVEKLTGQKALAEIALNDADKKVREAAAEKITDQKVLAEITRKDESFHISIADVEKLTDQKLLAEIAKTDRASKRVRLAAIEKIRGGKDAKLIREMIDQIKGHFTLVATGHYKGCKLMATIDVVSGEVCALEIEFKNAQLSRYLADEALAAWRKALAARLYVIPDALISKGWQSIAESGASYPSLTLRSPGHSLSYCHEKSWEWITIEP